MHLNGSLRAKWLDEHCPNIVKTARGLMEISPIVKSTFQENYLRLFID